MRLEVGIRLGMRLGIRLRIRLEIRLRLVVKHLDRNKLYSQIMPAIA